MKSYRVKLTNNPDPFRNTLKYVNPETYEFYVCACNKTDAQLEALGIWNECFKPTVINVERIKK